MRVNKRMPCKCRQKFAIIVDGECEFWYIQMLKRNERSLNINLEPKLPQKKSVTDQYNKLIELSSEYNKVFWIVDFDVIIRESRESRRGEKPIQTFSRYYSLLKEHENIKVIINNPCLEYWYLLHFRQTNRYYDSCDSLMHDLKRIDALSDYDKSEKFYTRLNQDIYLRLKPFLGTAIIHSNRLGDFDLSNPDTGISQMQLLFETDDLKFIVN